MPGVSIKMSVRDGCVLVTLRGELDVGTVADGVCTLTAPAASGARIIVNLAELTFMDCGSLRELVSVRTQARRAGGDLVLADPQPIVLRLLLLTDMIQSMPVFASVPEAVSGTRAAPPAPFITPEAAVTAAAGRRGAVGRDPRPEDCPAEERTP